MKNLLKWTLALTIILSLMAVGTIACSDDDDDETTAPATTTEPTNEPEPTEEPEPIETPEPTADPEPAAGVTIESTMQEILEAPGGEAILRECLGDANMDNPSLSIVFGMNLAEIVPMSGGLLTEDMIACVDTKLQELAADPAPAAVTIESTMQEILDAPGGEAVLRECLGDANMDNPSLSIVFGMNLREIVPMSGGLLTEDMIACVEGKLAEL